MYLFVYGVLIEEIASAEIRSLLAGLGPAAPATTRGTLYAVPDSEGWYPALLPGDGEVFGALREAKGANLAALDAFEGPEYVRRPIAVECMGNVITADAFCWRGAIGADFAPIPGGDFARWLAQTGRRAFGSA